MQRQELRRELHDVHLGVQARDRVVEAVVIDQRLVVHRTSRWA